MVDAVAFLITLIVNITLVVALPPMAKCPEGWSLHEGVRREGPHVGEFACYGPLPRACGDARPPDDGPCPKPEITRGRVYCTNGAKPIIVDYRTVGCTR